MGRERQDSKKGQDTSDSGSSVRAEGSGSKSPNKQKSGGAATLVKRNLGL